MSGDPFSTPESRAALARMERQELAEYARKQTAKEAEAVADAPAPVGERQSNDHKSDRIETPKPLSKLPFTPYRDFASASTKRWLTRDMFGQQEFSVAFGEPGSGKSVLIKPGTCMSPPMSATATDRGSAAGYAADSPFISPWSARKSSSGAALPSVSAPT